MDREGARRRSRRRTDSRSTIRTTRGTSRSPTSGSAATSIPRLASCRVAAVHLYNFDVDNRTRLATRSGSADGSRVQAVGRDGSRWTVGELSASFMAPINWRFRSGDEFEFNVVPAGERLDRAVRDRRRRGHPARSVPLAALSSSKSARRRSAACSRRSDWWFGRFYDGRLDQYRMDGRLESDAALDDRVLGRAQRRPSGRRATSSQTLVGNAAARQPVTRSVRSPATCSTTPKSNRSASTRGCGGRSGRSRISSSSTTTTCATLLDRWQLDSNQLLVKLHTRFRY